MTQSLLVISIFGALAMAAMLASSATTATPRPSASDSFFGNTTIFDKKRWRKRVGRGWRALTALTFLTLALGIGYLVLRASIQPGDLGPAKNMPGWSDREVNQTMTQARRLIAACYSYRERYGDFPKHLDDLTPHFLRNIEPPAVGHKKWTYSSYNQGQAFYLSFAANRRLYPAKSYATGRSPPWSNDD